MEQQRSVLEATIARHPDTTAGARGSRRLRPRSAPLRRGFLLGPFLLLAAWPAAPLADEQGRAAPLGTDVVPGVRDVPAAARAQLVLLEAHGVEALGGGVLDAQALAKLRPKASARAETVTLVPIEDNTLYEAADAQLSNARGPGLFAGRTNQGPDSTRRGLLAFGVAESIPAGSVILSATLTLHVSRTISGAHDVSLHRVLAGWGEGTSNAGDSGGSGAAATPGDATWVFRFFDTATWTAPGGDFSATPSATRSVGGLGAYTWGSTPQMVADVQGWLDRPAEDFGWLVKGEEATDGTAKRFESRESLSAAMRPVLLVQLQAPQLSPTPTATATVTPTGAPETVGLQPAGPSGLVAFALLMAMGLCLGGRARRSLTS
jgi:hypothetical protein